MTTRTLVVATGNPGKLRELTRLLADLPVQLVTARQVLGYAPRVDETGETFEQNARIKALAVAKLTSLPTLADDSGLEVDALGGRPGVYSARYAGPNATDADRVRKLLQQLEGVDEPRRTARFRCVACFVDPTRSEPAGGVYVRTAHGICEGRIALSPRGTEGFGYDPVFFLPEEGKTMAELSARQKDERSHRAAAIRALLAQGPLF